MEACAVQEKGRGKGIPCTSTSLFCHISYSPPPIPHPNSIVFLPFHANSGFIFSYYRVRIKIKYAEQSEDDTCVYWSMKPCLVWVSCIYMHVMEDFSFFHCPLSFACFIFSLFLLFFSFSPIFSPFFISKSLNPFHPVMESISCRVCVYAVWGT